MIIILIYLLLILLIFICVYIRNGTTLLQIKTIFWINTIFLAVSLLSLVISFSYTPVVFFSVIVITSALVYKLWFLLNYDSHNTQEILESSFSLVLTPFTRTEDKYEITLGGYPTSLRVIKFLPKTAILTYKGNWELNKGKVIQSLFRKKFRSILPKLVIHIKSNVKNI